jgi:hypothetical protein
MHKHQKDWSSGKALDLYLEGAGLNFSHDIAHSD